MNDFISLSYFKRISKYYSLYFNKNNYKIFLVLELYFIFDRKFIFIYNKNMNVIF